jgi:hypothetical protein
MWLVAPTKEQEKQFQVAPLKMDKSVPLSK